ncbi:hypothetical protein ACFY5D_07045 [Paeniglutamicibacter sp. NPDC012692]|uniref:hypothetical protein n=1 Tax=Paeniglutamicibacter sp. NPDC012692 TaxID=3364388 RepID=UPI003699FA2E
MDLMQQRYKRAPGSPSIDGYAVAKGCLVTVGAWLVGSLIWAIWIEVTRAVEPDVGYIPYLEIWPVFALVSVMLAMIAGFPLALLLDRVLRSVESPLIHVAVFLAFFTLLPAIPLGLSLGDDWILAYGYSSLLGVCAALGRAAAFRRGGSFRRPTTWA